MSDQVVTYCVGAPKSGTSWLWDYLYGHSETYFSAVKELHYFDVLEKGGRTWAQDGLAKNVEEAQKLADAGTIRPYRQQLLDDGKAWLAAFDGLNRDDDAYRAYIGLGTKDARVVGDFTPAYALMKEATFRDMASVAEDVRFVFLMRDPVARMWSNVRMDAGRKADEDTLGALVEQVIEQGDHGIAVRSNYRRTLNRLLAAVPRDKIYVEFYERLFTDEAMQKFCDFLGIAYEPADFSKVVWAGNPAPLPEGQVEQMVSYLKPQYNFVRKLMGDLPDEWTEMMVAA